MEKERLRDKVRGSLIGGACGDALGYAIEFVGSFEQICALYGEEGLTDYDLNFTRKEFMGYGTKKSAGPDNIGVDMGLVSDDTQMTLYTAEGLLEGEKTRRPMVETIRESYLAWFGGQTNRIVKISYDSKLAGIKELNQSRAPGGTCMSAMRSIYDGKRPANDSKGCGGIMRVAPVGLYGAARGWTLRQIALVAGETAELTHLHLLSTFSAATMAVIVKLCVAQEDIDEVSFKKIIAKAVDIVASVYGEEALAEHGFRNCISQALELTADPSPDWEIIENRLGGGWVAEETLAIALFSVLRHIDDFSGCLKCAVNHGGDSDSTGAVAGNIIGVILGYEAIPDRFKDRVQFKDLLLSIADDLAISRPSVSVY